MLLNNTVGHLLSPFLLHCMPLHDLAAPVDGEGGFAGGDGNAAEVALARRKASLGALR